MRLTILRNRVLEGPADPNMDPLVSGIWDVQEVPGERLGWEKWEQVVRGLTVEMLPNTSASVSLF